MFWNRLGGTMMKYIMLALIAVSSVSMNAMADENENSRPNHVLEEMKLGNSQSLVPEKAKSKMQWNQKKWGIVDPVNARLE